jgi:hypothetical protein
MPGPIQLFVSSSPELYAEREVIGQVIAALPLSIGWRIGHTPIPGEGSSGSVVRVEQCDLYALVLGHDFAAPMGAELRTATALGRQPLAYRKQCTHSPAAQDAIRRLNMEWHPFSDPSQLRALFERHLLRRVLREATRLGLEMDEVERLMELAQETERETEAEDGGRRRGDAGSSGVILGREVFEPQG